MPAQASLAQTDTERKHVIKTDGVSASLIAADQPDAAHSSNDASLAVDVYAPWDIKSIQEGLGGRYDRETIIDMLQKCRGDIDRAFAALLDEKSDDQADKKNGPVPAIPIKPSLQASRDTSPFSTGSKRSADDSDDSEAPQPARRVRPKRRFLSNLTLGVGISFRDEQDEVVSLNLRVSGPEDVPEHLSNLFVVDAIRKSTGSGHRPFFYPQHHAGTIGHGRKEVSTQWPTISISPRMISLSLSFFFL